MTCEEAIRIVRCWVRSRGAYTDHATWQTNNEAAKLAIEALEKQVPKKPIKKTNFNKDIFNGRYCPRCDLMFDRTSRFCECCGQALLWEDTE